MAMKVLMFGWEFPPYNSGGLGTACLGLTKGLSQRQVDLTFVLPRKFDHLSDHCLFVFADQTGFVNKKFINSLLTPYMTEKSYGSTKEKYGLNDGFGADLIEEVYMYAVKAAEALDLDNLDIDIIHAHDWLSFPAGILAKELTGKPLILHVHATEFDRGGGRGINSRVFEIEKRGMEKADHVIAVSQWTKNILINKYGINSDKISVVHNGVDFSEERLARPVETLQELKAAGKKIVLFLGRLTIHKGPDYFLQAAKLVLRHEPEAVFVISGSGDMEGQIMDLSASLGISDKVIFTGFVRGDDVHKIFKAADVYVLPSYSEPFGITPLEALSNGTPVLISRQSGVSEVLNHCLKTDFWDIEDMANKIICILQHKCLHQELTSNGCLEARGLNWETSADKCLEVYQKVLDNR